MFTFIPLLQTPAVGEEHHLSPCPPNLVVTQTSSFLLASTINLLTSSHALERVESCLSPSHFHVFAFLQPPMHHFL